MSIFAGTLFQSSSVAHSLHLRKTFCRKIKMKVSKNFLAVPTILVISVSLASSYNFTVEQKLLLEEIKLEAEKGGLPKTEVDKIQKFDKDVCYEKGCLTSALEIMSATNFSINPCKEDDWLDFACTRRLHSERDYSFLSQLDALSTKVDEQTLALLDGTVDTLTLIHEKDFLFQEAKTYYSQCINKGEQDSKDTINILEMLQKYGGWPIFTNKEPPTNFPWMSMIAEENRYERFGFTPLFIKLIVPKDEIDIRMEIGRTTFPYNLESLADYQAMITRMQRNGELEEPANTTQIASTLKFMSKFNSRILERLPSKLNSRETFTLEELQNETNIYIREKKVHWKVDWTMFLKSVFNNTDIKFAESSSNISLPFQAVMEVVSYINEEMKTVEGRLAIVNALHLNLASMLLQETTSTVDDLRTFKCADESGTREDICLERTKDIFGYSLGKTYLKLFYNDSRVTPEVKHLMENIKRGYIRRIKNIVWMSNETKEYLFDKVNSTEVFVAQPDWLKESRGLQNFYKGFKASNNTNSSYVFNFLNVNAWQLEKRRSWAHKVALTDSLKDFNIFDSKWNNYLGNVNAYFYVNNQIQIDVGILQDPIFDVNRPGFMNYGGLGMVLAHEMGHSFDTDGRTYNKFGEQGEFWDEASIKEYKKWVNQTAKFYESIPHHITAKLVKRVNPEATTIDEDISDLLGISISFFSYDNYLKELKDKGEKEKILPGLKSFTPRKLFYMKYSNMWCENVDVQSKFNQLLQSHSGGNRRASLPLRRSKEFKKTFGCNREPEVVTGVKSS